MSKIKTKKVLTPEQKKKRIRNIIIVAVILVAASIATYWMTAAEQSAGRE